MGSIFIHGLSDEKTALPLGLKQKSVGIDIYHSRIME
jgi:hypothetical protein